MRTILDSLCSIWKEAGEKSQGHASYSCSFYFGLYHTLSSLFAYSLGKIAIEEINSTTEMNIKEVQSKIKILG